MKAVHESGSRKTAVARATIKPGSGKIKVNSQNIDNYSPEIARMKIMEPIILADKLAKDVDISVKMQGGGYMSQAEAARVAISRALVEFTKSNTLRESYLEYDRQLLVADVRRKEMRKPNDSKARAKRQKSYR